MKRAIILFTSIFILSGSLFSAAAKEADYYEKLPKKKIKCLLCPKHCPLSPGEEGDCRARKNIEGRLIAINYGRIAALNIDPVEKKPLYHFYPGSPILSIASAGCNMHCKFCQNWTLSQNSPLKLSCRSMEPEDIIGEAQKNRCRMIAYTYSEPVVSYEFTYECAKLAKKSGLKNVLVTALLMEKDPLEKLMPYIDAVTVDIKSMDPEYYRKELGGELEPVLDNIISLFKAGIWIEIVYLAIPGKNDSGEMMRKFADWVLINLGTCVPVHILRFFPNYKMTDVPATPETRLKEIAEMLTKAGFKYVYLGNLRDSVYEATVCKKCGYALIERTGYVIRKNSAVYGKCPMCGTVIDGRF